MELAARGESETKLFNSTRLCHPDPERSRRGGICSSPQNADPSFRSGWQFMEGVPASL